MNEAPLNRFGHAAAALWKRLKSCPDTEGEQALVRFVLVSLIFGYLYFAHAFERPGVSPTESFNFWFTAGVVGVALVVLVSILVDPRKLPGRRAGGVVIDVSAITYGLYATGSIGSPLYVMLLWVIFGNGFRFGIGYLTLATVLSSSGFIFVITNSEFWGTHLHLSFGLLVGLFVLPLYGASLVHRLNEETARAERANDAKTRFLANMSHEIRTPLTGILGNVQLLRRSELATGQQRYVDAIGNSGDALLGLIDDILDISRIESGKLVVRRERVEIVPFVNSVCDQYRALAESRGLVIQSEVISRVPSHLFVDARHLRQVLGNLLSNAVKFTHEGTIRVSVSTTTPESEDVANVQFDVIDTGIGIPDDLKRRLFNTFVQGDESITRKYGGTGLGTAICKQLVENMGGRIGVRDSPSGGAHFWFTVPPASDNLTEALDDALAAGDVGGVTDLGDAGTMIISRDPAYCELFKGANTDYLLTGSTSDGITMMLRRCDIGKPIREVWIDTDSVPSSEIQLFSSILALHRELETTIVRMKPASRLPAGSTELVSDSRVALVDDMPETKDPTGSVVHLRDPNSVLSNPHVLVLEDTLTNQELMHEMLSLMGFVPHVVDDGETALDMLAEKTFGALIMDLHMPKMDGLEVLRNLRFMEVSGPSTPAIVVTADATDSKRRECEALSVVGFFTKPIDFARLGALLLRLATESESDGQANVVPGPKENHEPSSAATGPAVFPGTGGGAEVPLIDTDVIGELRRHLGDRNSAITRVLECFVDDVAELAAGLKQCSANGDNGAIFQIAHAIKGSACPVGAAELAEQARQLQYACSTDQDVEGAAARVIESYEATRHEVRKMLAH